MTHFVERHNGAGWVVDSEHDSKRDAVEARRYLTALGHTARIVSLP